MRIEAGITHKASVSVTDAMTAAALGATVPAFKTLPPVFATAYLVAFVEAACVEALEPFLEEGQVTVGTQINLSHVAPTTVGMDVSIDVKLIAVDRQRLSFQMVCTDHHGVVGEGYHERAIVDRNLFIARANSRLGSLGDV